MMLEKWLAKCFGYLQGNGHTVIVGEFGYNSASSYDINTFAPDLLSYLLENKINDIFYWWFNANDSQLDYLLVSDSTWCTVSSEKINRFKAIGVNPQRYIASANPSSILRLSTLKINSLIKFIVEW